MARRRWQDALRRRPRGVTEELWRFLVVGGAGFATDVGVFALLRTPALGLLEDHPVTAKVVSTAVATAVTWVGNRWWTWRHRDTASTRRELLLFVLANVVGMGIAVLCLVVSHYVLGFTSLLADQLSANGVGLVLGTAFRFVAYRSIVFRDAPRGETATRAQDTTRGQDPERVQDPEPAPVIPQDVVEQTRRHRADQQRVAAADARRRSA